MSQTVISVENLSKIYRLGQIGTGTLTNDIKVWWAKKLGRPNPMLKLGEQDHGNCDGETLWALKEVSFQVEQGEVLGIIGRNGAGKSTLLKILSRVTAPTSGCVKVKGRIASLLEVGTGFHPDLTGRENIYLNGAILGMTKEEIRQKFDEIVAFAEIEKFVDTPVKRYSSGMYVRLAFAVAAHLNSEILLVDEVLAVGDAEFQKKCLGKMGDVATKEGRTVLFVSHNMSAVEYLCNMGLVLLKGENRFLGSSKDAIQFYEKSHISFISEQQANGNVIYRNLTIRNGIKIYEIELLDEFYAPKEKLYTWDKVIFRLHYSADKDINMGSAVLKISTTKNESLFLLSTQPGLKIPFAIKKGKHYVDCIIENFPLSSGRYILGAGLAMPNIEWLCWDQEMAVIEIFARDVYQSGSAPNSKDALIAPVYTWIVNENV